MNLLQALAPTHFRVRHFDFGRLYIPPVDAKITSISCRLLGIGFDFTLDTNLNQIHGALGVTWLLDIAGGGRLDTQHKLAVKAFPPSQAQMASRKPWLWANVTILAVNVSLNLIGDLPPVRLFFAHRRFA